MIEKAASSSPAAVDSYRQACVFLLLSNREDPRFLAIQKSDTDSYAWRNQVALPGGHLDAKDAGPLEAAYRELEEEVNIDRTQVEFMGSIGHFQTVIKKRDVQVFVGWWDGNRPVRYDATEIARVLVIPLREIIHTHLSNFYHGRFPDVHELIYPYQDVVIWGLTARILHYFIELVYPLLEKGGFFQAGK